ncbi:MAG: hypothetical protein IE926_07675 [Micrococcales bacterium]|nr:hypothetical protein [Micrococcales bacterium]
MRDLPPEPDLDALLSRLEDRGLGDIPLRAKAALQPFSRGSMTAATNLLDKATDALDRGEDERADHLIAKAVALPYDEYEDAPPAEWQAHMAIFMAVTDACEDDVDADDVWLDAALHAMAEAPPGGRATLRDCLVTMIQDYDMPPRMVRRIRSGVADLPPSRSWRELHLASDEERVRWIRETLLALIAFEDALI